jgi:UDP-GlcNAc:undecaprenyl-phosphate GlcNAc-1-phosphate transferase
MDTLLAMARRSFVGRPMFSADKEHIHHRVMSRLRLSHRATVLTLYALCCFLAVVSLAMSFSNGWQCALLLGTLATSAGLVLRRLGYLDRGSFAEMVELRQRNKGLRRTVRAVAAGVSAARTPDDVGSHLHPLAEALGAARLSLRWGPGAERLRSELTVTCKDAVEGMPPFEVCIPVQRHGRHLGSLVVSWRDGRKEVLRDEELGLEHAARALARTLTRLPPARATVTHLPVVPQPELLVGTLQAASGASVPSRGTRR